MSRDRVPSLRYGGVGSFQKPYFSVRYSDKDEEDSKITLSYKQRNRAAHTQAERKRRDAIKMGYNTLQTLVTSEDFAGLKLSRANVIRKSIDYIQTLQERRKLQEEERNALKKDVRFLKKQQTMYEKMLKMPKSQFIKQYEVFFDDNGSDESDEFPTENQEETQQ